MTMKDYMDDKKNNEITKDAYKNTILLCFRKYKSLSSIRFDNNQVLHFLSELEIDENDTPAEFENNSDINKYPDIELSQLFEAFMVLKTVGFHIEKVQKCLYYENYEKAKYESESLSTDFILLLPFFTNTELWLEKSLNVDLHYLTFDINGFFKPLKRYFSILTSGKIQEGKHTREIIEEIINSDLVYLSNLVNLYKFLFPLYLITISPYFAEKYKTFSIRLLDTFKNMLKGATLQFIQLQEKKLNQEKEIENRGCHDGTTRILGIFTRNNDDIYLFRIDFPHKNEEDIHINLHEVKNGKELIPAGFPLEKNLVDSFVIDENIRKKLFLEDDTFYWFRTKTEQNIAEIHGIQEEGKKKLRALFRKYNHFEIEGLSKEKDYLSFINSYVDMLQQLKIDCATIESFDKEDKKNIELIKQIRKELQCRDIVYALSILDAGDTIENLMHITGLSREIVLLIKDELDNWNE